MSPVTAQLIALREFPGCSTEKRSLADSLSQGDGTESWRIPKQLGYTAPESRKLQSKRTLKIYRESPLIIQ